MATIADPGPGEGWRLGEAAEATAPVHDEPAEGASDRSRSALERPVAVVTVELLAWSLVALWTVLTRLAALGARPLGAAAARNALIEFDLANRTAHAAAAGVHALSAGWVHLLAAGLFASIGASDYSARLVFALSGLVIVAIAFLMRRYVGRAGAIALATLLALSPSVTYFSRAGSTVAPASAMALVTIALFMALIREPGRRRALRLGCAGGLMVAAGPTGVVTAAALVVALGVIGLWDLIMRRSTYLGLRVWLDRHAGLAVATIAAAAVFVLLSESVLPGIIGRIRGSTETSLWPLSMGNAGFERGVAFYGPAIALYEFLITIMTIVGALLLAARRIRSRFAWWCLVWTVATVAIYLWIPVRMSESVMAMALPAAFLGAFAVEHLHHTGAWRFVRYPLAVLALLTVYEQVLTNFVFFAPDASEAQWARHANLAWRDGATTLQTAERCREITRRLATMQAGVYFSGRADALALRWYLRSLMTARSAESAAVVVNTGAPARVPGDAETETSYALDFQEAWQPDLARIDGSQLLRYLLTAQVWGPITTDATVITMRITGESSPTIILPPGSSR